MERMKIMATKTFEEKILELQKKQEQFKAQERALKKRHSEEERKKRTRRLIELGGIVESVLGRPTTEEDKIKLLEFLKKQERNGNFFTKAMNEGMKPSEAKVEQEL